MSSNTSTLWVVHRKLFINKLVISEAFGNFQAIIYLGSFMALASGISILKIVQFFADLLDYFKPPRDSATEIEERTNFESSSFFQVLSEKLDHLREHFKAFVKMSSIHGLRNLAGSFREKIFWIVVISAATWSCAHFLRSSFEAFKADQLSLEFDERPWNINEVFKVVFLSFLKRTVFSSRFRSQLLLTAPSWTKHCCYSMLIVVSMDIAMMWPLHRFL